MSDRYAREKLGLAVFALATSAQSIQERLGDAGVELAPVNPQEQFEDPERRKQFQEIMGSLMASSGGVRANESCQEHLRAVRAARARVVTGGRTAATSTRGAGGGGDERQRSAAAGRCRGSRSATEPKVRGSNPLGRALGAPLVHGMKDALIAS
jgi:hypothetical protein